MRLGKHKATHDPRDLQFAHYRTSAALPPLPASFGHERAVTVPWGMLGNDEYGDCVLAGADHETMLWNAERGVSVPFTRHTALADYSAVTGFDPGNPDTDQGTNVRDALVYRRKIGVADAHGARHKIGSFAALEPGNYQHIEEALYLFGVVGIGIEFPSSAMGQFNHGKIWSVVHGASLQGGHYVPVVALRDRHLVCVTWGKLQPMTKGFFERYCDEAWALLSPEMMAGGKSPEGFDLPALQSDLAELCVT